MSLHYLERDEVNGLKLLRRQQQAKWRKRAYVFINERPPALRPDGPAAEDQDGEKAWGQRQIMDLTHCVGRSGSLVLAFDGDGDRAYRSVPE